MNTDGVPLSLPPGLHVADHGETDIDVYFGPNSYAWLNALASGVKVKMPCVTIKMLHWKVGEGSILCCGCFCPPHRLPLIYNAHDWAATSTPPPIERPV